MKKLVQSHEEAMARLTALLESHPGYLSQQERESMAELQLKKVKRVRTPWLGLDCLLC